MHLTAGDTHAPYMHTSSRQEASARCHSHAPPPERLKNTACTPQTHPSCRPHGPQGDLTCGLGVAETLACVLTTVRVAPLTIADMDVIDVGVGFQREDEADQVCGRQQHRNGVHQGPEDIGGI